STTNPGTQNQNLLKQNGPRTLQIKIPQFNTSSSSAHPEYRINVTQFLIPKAPVRIKQQAKQKESELQFEAVCSRETHYSVSFNTKQKRLCLR
ncbi:MAG: hypothetical protein KDA74_23260, partial [Planctomycetaceae bacterium]|nr:hypothetical protein [Planctomycetaceae bacterium]